MTIAGHQIQTRMIPGPVFTNVGLGRLDLPMGCTESRVGFVGDGQGFSHCLWNEGGSQLYFIHLPRRQFTDNAQVPGFHIVQITGNRHQIGFRQ